jgi:hypothetical protein
MQFTEWQFEYQRNEHLKLRVNSSKYIFFHYTASYSYHLNQPKLLEMFLEKQVTHF